MMHGLAAIGGTDVFRAAADADPAAAKVDITLACAVAASVRDRRTGLASGLAAIAESHGRRCSCYGSSSRTWCRCWLRDV